ncbi:NAD(P)-binding domain-containing protein [Pedobacter panaciterrae]
MRETGNRGVPFVSNNPKPTRSEALEYYRRVALKFELNTKLFESVDDVAKQDVGFIVTTSKSSYLTRNIIISTGFYDLPNKIDIPGEDLPKVAHYYKDPHYYAMQNVIVIGASNSSVDAALETYRKGANVTMVVRDESISKRVKYWVRPDVMNRIEEGNIKAYFHSELVSIANDTADIRTPEGIITIPNDFVLALIMLSTQF